MSIRHEASRIIEGRDIEVNVEGYGRLKLSTLKKMVTRQISDMAKDASKGRFGNIQHTIESGVLLNKLKGIQAAEEALDDQ